MQEELELKSCPFCGRNQYKGIGYDEDNDCYVHCKYCGAKGPSRSTKENAIDSWNWRFPNVDKGAITCQQKT